MQLIAGVDGRWDLLVQQGDDLVDQGQLLLLPLGLWEGRQGRFAELAQVAGQALGGFGGVQGGELVERRQVGGEGLICGLAEGVVVEAWR